MCLGLVITNRLIELSLSDHTSNPCKDQIGVLHLCNHLVHGSRVYGLIRHQDPAITI